MPSTKRTRSSRRKSEEKDAGELGEMVVQAQYNGEDHDAKILKVTENPVMYFVQYVGWNERYSQWVPESHIRFPDGKQEANGSEESIEAPQEKKLKSGEIGNDMDRDNQSMNPKGSTKKSEEGRVESVDTPAKEETPSVKVEQKEEKGSPRVERSISYEEQRLENIRRNQEMLKKLNLDMLAGGMKKPKKNVIVRKKSSRNRNRNREPSRRSLRVQGLSSDGQKIPDDFREPKKTSYRQERMEEEGSLEISLSNKEFLKGLMSSKDTEADAEPAEIDVSTYKYAEKLAALEVQEGYVAKVTKERIYSAAIHPGSEVLIAAGDKNGNLGIWKPSMNSSKDGIVKFHPHGNVIAGLMFSNLDPNKLYSSSYDGHIRVLDLQKQEFGEIVQNELSFYGIDFFKGSSILYAADVDGAVHKIDPRNKSHEKWHLHDNKIFTVRINEENPFMFCTASLDRTMRVWDARKIKANGKSKAVHVMVHDLCVTGASYSPDGKNLVSCCNDNLLRIWETSGLKSGTTGEDGPEPASKIRHNNKTGRWLTKFKCEWDPKQKNAFIIGSMERPRCVEIYGVGESSKTSLIMRLRDDYVGSVQSVNLFHPTQDVVLSANSSGRCHVWSKST